MLLRFACTLLLLASSPAAAQVPALFEAPWMAYNAGYFIQAPMGGGTDGRWPSDIVATDLNGDGVADLVVARNIWNGGLAVFLGTGDGYAPPAFYSAAPGAESRLAVGDLDGDGHIDIVLTGGAASASVSVYRGSSTGTLQAPANYPTAQPAVAVVVADLNGDGLPDIATADHNGSSGTGRLSVLLNAGGGTFGAPLSFPLAAEANDIAAGDLDGDGDVDLVIAHNAAHVSVLRNDGAGTFGAAVQLEGLGSGATIRYASVVLADLDGDGDLDIAAGHNRTGDAFFGYDELALFDNHGTGTFAAPRYVRLSQYRGGPSALAAGDVNGDGLPDLFAASPHLRDVRVLLSNGAGGYHPPVTVIAGQWTRGLALADLDGDGHLDLATADAVSMAATVHLNDGTGRFPEAPVARTVEGWFIAGVGDLNRDGHLDVVTSAAGRAWTYLGNGAGGFATGPVHGSGRVHGPRLYDLNGDGILDLLYAGDEPANQWHFYTALGDGTGAFGPPTQWPVGTSAPPNLHAFDFDGDGDLDVVFQLRASDLITDTSPVYIFRNAGNATFTLANAFEVAAGPANAAAGDFNGDGRLDFATAHQGAYGHRNYINVHFGNGDLTFEPWVAYTVGFGPYHIEAVDLNGDGVLDLVTGNTGVDNTGDETVSVLIGQPGGLFAPAVTYYAPYNYETLGLTGLAVGDADGDGHLDLMVSSSGSNDVAFYRNRGDGTFAYGHRYGIGERASSLFFADATGDGVSDLLSITHGYAVYSPRLTVLRGTGGAMQAPVAVSAQPVGGPVTIGPGGGSFTYRVTLTNTTAQPQSFQAWTAVTGPVSREPVLGPMTVTLPPGATVAKTLRQQVPGAAPAGAYTYHVRLGTFGGAVMASDSFPFTKQGAAAARGADAGEAEGWSVSGWEAASASSVLVGGFALGEARPNPFTRQSALTLEVAAAQHVRAEVFDALGRRVAVLLDEATEAGAHALVFDGSALPAGVYVVRVTGETFSAARRLTLLR